MIRSRILPAGLLGLFIIMPACGPSLYEQSLNYYNSGEFDKAEIAAEVAVDNNPSIDSYILLAKIYAQQGKRYEAVSIFQELARCIEKRRIYLITHTGPLIAGSAQENVELLQDRSHVNMELLRLKSYLNKIAKELEKLDARVPPRPQGPFISGKDNIGKILKEIWNMFTE